MALLTTQNISSVGTEVVYSAASAGGDSLSNSTKVVVALQNTSGVQRTITILAEATKLSKDGFGPLDRDDIVVTIEDGETKFIGPFEYAFEDIKGQVFFTYDNEAGLGVGSVLLPKTGGPALPAILRQSGQPILRQNIFPILNP